MINHKKVYLKALGYDINDHTAFTPCEISPGKRSVDIHHIIGRGKGGEDRIENLMALTRENHLEYGDKKIHMCTLFLTHRTFLKENNVEFDNDWFEDKLKKYTGA